MTNDEIHIVDFNSINKKVLITLLENQFSFTPQISIVGLTYEQELDLLENLKKYNIDTSSFKVKISYPIDFRNGFEYDKEIYLMFVNILSKVSLSYNPKNVFANKTGTPFFANIESFSTLED